MIARRSFGTILSGKCFSGGGKILCLWKLLNNTLGGYYYCGVIVWQDTEVLINSDHV